MEISREQALNNNGVSEQVIFGECQGQPVLSQNIEDARNFRSFDITRTTHILQEALASAMRHAIKWSERQRKTNLAIRGSGKELLLSSRIDHFVCSGIDDHFHCLGKIVAN